jgi:hypothetical protein
LTRIIRSTTLFSVALVWVDTFLSSCTYDPLRIVRTTRLVAIRATCTSGRQGRVRCSCFLTGTIPSCQGFSLSSFVRQLACGGFNFVHRFRHSDNPTTRQLGACRANRQTKLFTANSKASFTSIDRKFSVQIQLGGFTDPNFLQNFKTLKLFKQCG